MQINRRTTTVRKKESFFTPFSSVNLSKRHRFVISVFILSLMLFFSEHQLGRSGVIVAVVLSLLADALLLAANYSDIKQNFSMVYFILPFFFSLACGLFYFLIPIRFLTRILMTTFYAVGLYSIFLSQNIFSVASIRTIGLLSSARTVSFVMTLVTYFFLSVLVFSLHLTVLPTAFLVFIYSFFLILHSLWTITLEKSLLSHMLWAIGLTICLFEISFVLWFWPSSFWIIALFLTGFFYTIVGLSQVWLERRLFRGVMWEYIWLGVAVFSALLIFTPWRG